MLMNKKQFKLLAIIPKKDGSTYWMRCGSAFTNKDDSINIYMDALPRGNEWKFQLRELTEEDFKKRETNHGMLPPLDGASLPGSSLGGASRASESAVGDVPF